MKIRYFFTIALISISTLFPVQWTVVGGGPAGIVVVGLLLDLGVAPQDVAWIDPEFNVGRLGQYYSSVPGNTKTQLYIEFMNSCKTFLASGSPAIAALQQYEQAVEYPLSIVVKPLQDITHYLRTLVSSQMTVVTGLDHVRGQWHLELANGVELDSTCVVFATGSHPHSLHYPCDNEISLDCALNKDLLAQLVTAQDTVAVVGSAHSAVLAMKFLSELPTGRIINFYKKPLVYTQDMGSWLLHSSSGLKGVAAQWAKNVLEGDNPPVNILRLRNTPEARAVWLPVCTKIIYAAGYERNTLPALSGQENPELTYDSSTGIIAPGLFGIGIAFPQIIIDPAGNEEHKIGLNSFMNYALEMLPLWMQNRERITNYQFFENLFAICAL